MLRDRRHKFTSPLLAFLLLIASGLDADPSQEQQPSPLLTLLLSPLQRELGPQCVVRIASADSASKKKLLEANIPVMEYTWAEYNGTNTLISQNGKAEYYVLELDRGREESYLAQALTFVHPRNKYIIYTEDLELLRYHKVLREMVYLLVFHKIARKSIVVYQLRHCRTSFLEAISHFNGSDLSTAISRGVFSSRIMSNLCGRPFKATGVPYSPFFTQTVLENGTLIQDGLEVNFVKALTDSVNGRPVISTPADGAYWGEDFDGDGVFDGMVGELQNRLTDIGFGQLFIKSERMSLMDFTTNYDYEFTCFLVRKPLPLPQFMAIIRPFTVATWGMILFLVGVSVAFFLVYNSLFSSGAEVSTYDALTIVVSIIFSESHNKLYNYRSESSRLFLAAFLLGVFTLSKSYSGALVSFLSVPLTQKPINSMLEIVQADLPTASLGSSSYLLSSKDPVMSQMIPLHRGFDDFDVAFRNLSAGEIAMYQSKQYLDFQLRVRLTNDYGEPLAHIAQECPEFFYVSLGLEKNSVYKEIFDEKIKRFKEAGLIQKWDRDEKNKAGKLAQTSKSRADVNAFTLQEFQGPLLTAAAMLLPALLVFLIELLNKLQK